MTGFLKETNNKNWVFYFEKEERNKKVRLFKAVKPWNWETKNLIKTRKLNLCSLFAICANQLFHFNLNYLYDVPIRWIFLFYQIIRGPNIQAYSVVKYPRLLFLGDIFWVPPILVSWYEVCSGCGSVWIFSFSYLIIQFMYQILLSNFLTTTIPVLQQTLPYQVLILFWIDFIRIQ